MIFETIRLIDNMNRSLLLTTEMASECADSSFFHISFENLMSFIVIRNVRESVPAHVFLPFIVLFCNYISHHALCDRGRKQSLNSFNF